MRIALFLVAGLAVADLAACRTSGSTSMSTKHPPVELPVVVEADRFFLQTKTTTGAPIRLYLDSAGGMFLTKTAAERLRLATRTEASPDGGEPATVTEFPRFYDARIPRPGLEAFPVREEADGTNVADGMLGAAWFKGRVFTFDYAGGQLWLRAPDDVPSVPAAHRIPVGFPRNMQGEIGSPYGRVQMQVDGATIDMLFDTGATVKLTPEALKQLGGTAVERATSFITETVFERWRAAHPDWRVIDAADQNMPGSPMIEVPKVAIAGYEVGPVWFTRRPDKNFHVWMAQWMDERPDGALGNSALRYFKRVTVDWANGTASFEK